MFLWRAELAEEWADSHKLLTATPELAAWTLASDGVTPCDVIEHRDGTLIGINRVVGESFEVTRDTQIVCKLNLRSLATRIVEALEGRIDYSLSLPDANVHRIGRLPPRLASVPVHMCVRSDAESLLAASSSLATSSQLVILVSTLLHTNIDVDALAVRFQTIVVALDELIVERDGRWQVNRDIDRISKSSTEPAEHLQTAFQGESLCYRPTQDPGWQF